MTVWYVMDLVGTGVFAISGALSALGKKMYHDLFGLFFIGFLTAVGGGTLRDVIIGSHPIAWDTGPKLPDRYPQQRYAGCPVPEMVAGEAAMATTCFRHRRDRDLYDTGYAESTGPGC